MSTAFLITPFSPARAGGEEPQVYDAVQKAVAEAVKSVGLELVHPKEMAAAGPIAPQVRRAIDQADVVIAILTGHNPNVFLELGWADPTRSILISDRAVNLPFDVRHLRALTYEDADASLSTFPERLEGAIRATTAATRKRKALALDRPDYRSEVDHVIAYRTEVFVGREKDLSNVARVAAERAPQYLLLTGGAGTGKSALIAELVLRHEQRRWPTAVNPRLLYFFVRQHGANRSIDFLRALNAQMLALLDSDEPMAFELPAMETQFAKLWTASMRLARAEEPLLLMVDGLDEAAAEKASDLARYLPSALTDYVHVVVTSRPSPDPKSRVELGHPLRSARLHALRAFSVGEIEEMLRSFGVAPPRLAELAARVWAATKGLPLLARFVSRDAVSDVSRLDALENDPPADIRDYFVKQFEHLDAIAETKESVWAVFRTLTVGFGATTTDDLVEILGRGKNKIVKAIAAGERFLVSAQDGWELMHVELGRVLEQRQFSSRELEEAKREVVAWCKKYQDKNWPSSTPTYVLRHFLRHLSEREDHRGVVDACAAGYLEAKLERLLSPRDFDDDFSLLLTSCRRLADPGALFLFTLKRARFADEVAVFGQLEQFLDSLGQVLLSRHSVVWRRWVAVLVLGQKPIGLLNLCAGLTPGDGAPPTEIFERAEALVQTFASGKTRDEATARLIRELSRWGAAPLERARSLCDSIGALHVRASAYLSVAARYAKADQTNAATYLFRSLDEAQRVLERPTEESSPLSTLIEIAQAFPTISGESESRAGLDRVVALSKLLADPKDVSKIVSTASHGFAVLGDTSRATSLLLQTLRAGHPSRFGGISTARSANAIIEHSLAAGGAAETREILDRITEAVDHVADTWVQGDVLAAVAHGYARCGDMEASSEVLKRAISAGTSSWGESDDGSACVDAYAGLAKDAAIACLDRVRAALEDISDEKGSTRIASVLARGYSMSGRDDIACDLLDREFERLAEVRTELDLSSALSCLSMGYASLRDPAIARRRLDSVLERGGSLKDAISLSQLFAHLSGNLDKLGMSEAARRIDGLQELVAGGLSSADNRPAAYARVAALYARAGDVDSASRSLHQAARSAADSNSFGYFGIYLKSVFASFRNRAAAAQVLERLPAILVDAGNAPVVVRMLLAFARAANTARDVTQTRAVLDRAHQTALRISAEAARCRVLCDITKVADRLHCTDLAEATLDDAERAARQIKDSFGLFGGHSAAIANVANAVEELKDDALATQMLIRLGRVAIDTIPAHEAAYARSLVAVARVCTKRARSDQLQQVTKEIRGLALEIVDVYQRHRLLVAVADASNQHFGPDRAREILEQLRETLGEIADGSNRADVMALMASSFIRLDVSSSAASLLRDAFELLFPEAGPWYWGSDSVDAACAIVRAYGDLADETQAINGLSRACTIVDRLPWDASVVVAEIAKSHAAILTRGSHARVLDAWHSAAPGTTARALAASVYWRAGDRREAIDMLSQSAAKVLTIKGLDRRRTALLMVAHGAADIRGDLRGVERFPALLHTLSGAAEECGCSEVLALVGRGYINVGKLDAALALLPRISDPDAFADLCAALLSGTTADDEPDELFGQILVAAAPKGSGMLVRAIEQASARFPERLSRSNLEQLDRGLAPFTEAILATSADEGETLETGAVGAARAAILVNAKRYETAARQYAKATETYELQHAQTWTSWGICLSELGLHEEAVERYQRALAANPMDGLTLAAFGISENALGRWTTAAERFRAAIPLLPEHARATVAERLFSAGRKMFDAGDLKNAERAFADAWNHYADRVECTYWRGVSHFNLGELTAAEEDFLFALEQDGTHVGARFLLARTRFNLRRYAEAVAGFTELIARRAVPGDALYWRGRALLSQRKLEEALQDFSSAVELAADDARSYYFRGFVRQLLRAYDDAESDATAAIAREYGAAAYELRAEIREALGKLQEAEQDFSVALEAEPEDARLRLARGRVRVALNEFGGADQDLSAALESLDEPDGADYQRRGVARLGLGRASEAEEDLMRARALGRQGPEVAYGLGLARLNQGKLVAARSDLTTAIEQGVNDPHAFFALGVAKAGLKDYEGAEADLSVAVSQRMDDAEVYRWRSLVRVQLGALGAAIEDCTLAEVKAAGSPAAIRSRGYINLATGAFDAVITAYRLALAAAEDSDTQFELGLALLLARKFDEGKAAYGDAASRATAGELIGAADELEYWIGKYRDRVDTQEAASAVASIRSILRDASSAHKN